MVMVCLGLYFVFPACKTFVQLQTERKTPYEIIANTDKSLIELDTLLQIEGVESASPIMQIEAELAYGDYALSCKINAVYSNYLAFNITEGVVFPDNSNMPFLVLNKAAAQSFVSGENKITISTGDIVLLEAEGSARKAVICGVFDDNSTSPVIYMSYSLASKEYARRSSTQIAFSLTNKGSAERVISNLQKYGLYADADTNTSLAWELLVQQVWQSAIVSIGLLASSIVLMREKRKTERKERKGEQASLLLSGMTATEVREIYPLRFLLTDLFCMVMVIAAAVITGTYSLFGIGMAACLIIVHCIVGSSGELG